MGFTAWGQWLWRRGLVVPWRVVSSCTRDQTVSPALAGRFLTTEPTGKSPISNFWRNFHNIFYSGCANLYSHQQCMKVFFSPHSCLFFSVYLASWKYIYIYILILCSLKIQVCLSLSIPPSVFCLLLLTLYLSHKESSY